MKGNSEKYMYSMFRSYVIGFVLSMLLTVGAYVVVITKMYTGTILVFVLALLGLTQLIVQLLFFLHLGQESKPRWNVVFFISTIGIILILIIGSLWIMNNLNY